ncbi:MAG TPA: hypothetical protein VEO01_20425 [Pseudonocardiaceae bacterium]|nr:hypothetical protein [Pseudonocardiaceae bacterium]
MPSPNQAHADTVRQRVLPRARRWPQIRELTVRYRAGFAYITVVLDDGEDLQLCRLRDTGQPDEWGFALYTYSGDRYEDNILPTGSARGTPEDAFDCACGLYLGDPPAESDPRRINALLH